MDEWDNDYEEDVDPVRPRAEGVRILGAEEAAAAVSQDPPTVQEPLPFDRSIPRERDPEPESDFGDDDDLWPLDDNDPNVAPPSAPAPPNLPHWTEPATGEVPAVLSGRFGESDVDIDEDDNDEDLAAWSALSGGAPRWRDQHDDWGDSGYEDASVLAGSDPPMGALDERATSNSIFSFDDDDADDGPESFGFSFDEPEVEPIPLRPASSPPTNTTPRAPRTRPPRAPRPTTARAEPRQRQMVTAPPRDMQQAIGLGAILGVVALVLFKLGPAWTMVLAIAVVVLAAAELYDVLRRAGYQPATLVGLAGTLGIMITAYHKGETALPLVMLLVLVATFGWYLIRVVHARPTVNVAATMMAFLWTGVLGSYAALLLSINKPGHTGVAFLFGAVLATVANDTGAFFFGSRLGSKPFAPDISPNKTIEGLIGGTLTTLIVCEIILKFVPGMFPWDGGKIFWLAIVVSIVAPLGDLAESMIKRDLGIKDMGNLLPGHGGVLDRFDALLFVLPATYYLVRVLYL